MIPYKCSRCRTRNSSPTKITSYSAPRGAEPLKGRELKRHLRAIGGRKCWSCGHTAFYVDKTRAARKKLVCRCGGGLCGRTGSIPHRKGGTLYCEHNPEAPINHARDSGASEEYIEDLKRRIAEWEATEAASSTRKRQPVGAS